MVLAWICGQSRISGWSLEIPIRKILFLRRNAHHLTGFPLAKKVLDDLAFINLEKELKWLPAVPMIKKYMSLLIGIPLLMQNIWKMCRSLLKSVLLKYLLVTRLAQNYIFPIFPPLGPGACLGASIAL